ncbi:heavy metal translocating P-type ATPase [uncultured Helicobacter sp.]|uniref:heavy metal translocating P-type ATPase n=1 Tax=uncultured Helicobacter sp. TaxID=175537 RepID=UPI00374ED312
MQTFQIKNLDCASCADKLERKLRESSGVREVQISFATNTLRIDCDDISAVREIIGSLEPKVQLTQKIQKISFFTPQFFGLLGLIALFLVSIGLWHWSGMSSRVDSMSYDVVGIKLLWIGIYLISGRNVFRGALRSFRHREFFDENVLMLVASMAAFGLGAWEEAVSIMLFFATGEYLQEVSVRRSKEAISEGANLVPSVAHRLEKHSSFDDLNLGAVTTLDPASMPVKNFASTAITSSTTLSSAKTIESIQDRANLAQDLDLADIDPRDLREGDIIVLYPGEMLPCDSVLLEESASFNTAAISGESLPIESKKGEEILSGSIALGKALKFQVLRPFEKSQIAQIAELIASATLRKSPTENFITTFARYYTPLVFAFALALALIPPLVFAQSFEEWAYRALVVLMVSCPCALVVSVPIGYFGGLAAASKRGALIKGSNYLEALSKLSTIAFDKTGTLTKGMFEVIDICPSEGFSKDEVLANALCAQNLSNHPIAQSIRQVYQNLSHKHHISEYEELSGLGVRAVCNDHEILAGNDKILHTFDIAHNTCYVKGSVVHIVRDKQYMGYILIADVLKSEASAVVGELRRMGVEPIILSGDGEYPCKVVADKLGCAYQHSLLPQDKARVFSEIKARSSAKVAFVGDGINDAPTLALADVGVAMGSGSDISAQSADVIITNNSLQTLLNTIQIAKKTKTIIYQNIALALGIKGVFIVLGLFGLASIWEAIFGDVGVALLALANAMRCSRVS